MWGRDFMLRRYVDGCNGVDARRELYERMLIFTPCRHTTRQLLSMTIRLRAWTPTCRSWRRLFRIRARSCGLWRRVSCSSNPRLLHVPFTDYSQSLDRRCLPAKVRRLRLLRQAKYRYNIYEDMALRSLKIKESSIFEFRGIFFSIEQRTKVAGKMSATRVISHFYVSLTRFPSKIPLIIFAMLRRCLLKSCS